MIYLASPYSDPSLMVRQARFEAAADCAAKMIRAGDLVFSPICHSHPIHLRGVGGDWESWQEFDRAIMAVCKKLVVLRLDGWDRSRGVLAELRLAYELGVPIRHVDPE